MEILGGALFYLPGFPGGTSRKESNCLIQETKEARAQSLGWDDPMDEETATRSSISAWRTPWTEEAGGYSPPGHTESDTTEAVEHVCTHSISHTEPQFRYQQKDSCHPLWVTDLNQHWLWWL